MYLVNLSIKNEIVPKVWKLASVTPVFKAGDKSDMNNYSILPIASKIIEKWITKQIIEFLSNSQKPLHSMQFGFRPHHSTETALAMIMEKIKCQLDRNRCVGAVFLDLKRAFDTVNHKVLLSILSRFNFSAQTINWFHSYLSHREQCPVVGGASSAYMGCPVGVPQGSILGSILFSLYINDLPEYFLHVEVQLYADDTVIFTKPNDPEKAACVLSTYNITHIQTWLNRSCPILNAKKPVCLSKQPSTTMLSQSGVFLGTEELEVVNEFKCLGVTIDSRISFKNHDKINQIKKNQFNLCNFNQIRGSLSDAPALMFLHSMIRSHQNYCITSWSMSGSTILKTVELLYKKALKTLDKKKRSLIIIATS